MKIWLSALSVLIGPAVIQAALADPPPGNLGQLQQLNRTSEATLGTIQRRAAPPPDGVVQANRQNAIKKSQRAELHRLQERQRRELLRLNQRAKTRPDSGPAYSLRGIEMQSRFQRQQQYQRNRHRLRR